MKAWAALSVKGSLDVQQDICFDKVDAEKLKRYYLESGICKSYVVPIEISYTLPTSTPIKKKK